MANPPKKAARSCLRCGTRNPVDTEFCLRCGEKLRGIKVTNKQEKKSLRLNSVENQDIEKRAVQTPPTFEVNKIYCGDCLQIMRKIPDNFVQSLSL